MPRRTGPDWGVSGVAQDNPIDATTENGIENIELPRLEPIAYDLLVEYWGSGVPTTASMVINVAPMTLHVTSPTMRPKDVWRVGRIDDCSGNWMGGCRLPLP